MYSALKKKKKKGCSGKDLQKRKVLSLECKRVGDEKLIIIISVAVTGINDHIRFYSQMLCTAAINTSNTTRTQTGANLCCIHPQPVCHSVCHRIEIGARGVTIIFGPPANIRYGP